MGSAGTCFNDRKPAPLSGNYTARIADMKHLFRSVTILLAFVIATQASAQRTGPGPFAETGTGPGIVPPRGAGSLFSTPQPTGWVSRSGRRDALVDGRAASALLRPTCGLLRASRLLCAAPSRLLRTSASLLLWAAGTLRQKPRSDQRQAKIGACLSLLVPPPLCPGHHHVEVGAAALGTDEPLAPLWNGCLRAVTARKLGGVGLDLVAARLTPHDESDASRSRVADRHRRAGLRFH
jgi:hypothetical protein